MMKSIFMACVLLISVVACRGQSNPPQIKNAELIGGPCEGCEAIFEFENFNVLNAIDTLPEFSTANRKLKITGTIFQSDGKTPADNVVLYVYHTNQEGQYAPPENAHGWANRHGKLRGWIKTDHTGQYTFFTQEPGAYGNQFPHIHATILEPDGRYYYIEAFRFKQDNQDREFSLPALDNRGGSGMVSLNQEDHLLIAERDIILGLNIPGYH
ncbi:MAG: intradiol ring-cleavage dioxygenase [Caldithrix sp.]|nr:intradiol ring-cleavage dioxygenase [Caldithrix sp.]